MKGRFRRPHARQQQRLGNGRRTVRDLAAKSTDEIAELADDLPHQLSCSRMPEIDVEEKRRSLWFAFGGEPFAAPVIRSESAHGFQGIEKFIALSRSEGVGCLLPLAVGVFLVAEGVDGCLLRKLNNNPESRAGRDALRPCASVDEAEPSWQFGILVEGNSRWTVRECHSQQPRVRCPLRPTLPFRVLDVECRQVRGMCEGLESRFVLELHGEDVERWIDRLAAFGFVDDLEPEPFQVLPLGILQQVQFQQEETSRIDAECLPLSLRFGDGGIRLGLQPGSVLALLCT